MKTPFTPKEKAKYEFDMTTERDIQNFIDYARQEGREEGREEAKALRDAEIVKAMLAKKYPVEDISEITGLTASEIEKLS